jgi:hypothetical protein
MASNFSWNDSAEWTDFLQNAIGELPTVALPTDPDKAAFFTPAFGSWDDIQRAIANSAQAGERATLNALHVEVLLDQAVELVDRIARTRERIASLRIAAFQNAMDLWEFMKLDEIHEKEIKEGRYSAPVDEKVSHVDGNKLQIDSWKTELKITDDFLQWYAPNGSYEDRLSAAQIITAASTVAGPDEQQPDPSRRVRTQSLFTWSRPVHEADFKQRFDTFKTQKENLAGSIASAEKRLTGEEANSKYMQNSLPLQLQRVQVARELVKRKLHESRRTGGVLKYSEQIEPLLKSAEQDLAHAVVRLSAASDGLAALFGYQRHFPVGGSNTPFDFDTCMQWARDAIIWLRTFSRHDETLTIPISLKRVAGDTWFNGRASGNWQFTISDDSAQAAGLMLKDRRYVRVRGLSAYVDGITTWENWQIKIKLPQDGKVRFRDNSIHSLPEQAKMPSVWLGRVTRRQEARAPEVVGSTTLLNASPLGRWQVSALSQSADGGPLEKVDDIIIELTVASQSA